MFTNSQSQRRCRSSLFPILSCFCRTRLFLFFLLLRSPFVFGSHQNEMVSATVEPAGRAIVMCVAVVARILYGAYGVLSIGTRGRGLPSGMVGLLCFAPEMEVWRGGFVWDVDWIYRFRAADCRFCAANIRFRQLMGISCEILLRPFLRFRTLGMLNFVTSD